jgi:alpha-2-macroglobulin-like protein
MNNMTTNSILTMCVAGLLGVWGCADDGLAAGDFEGPGSNNGGSNNGADPGGNNGGGSVEVPDDGEGEGPALRVREYFPETLLFEPSVITGPDGLAELPVTMADSITTWRVSGLANGPGGRLGSGEDGIRVFQDFFVDIDFPLYLTQNDWVAVPIAIFNYLDQPQTVRISVDPSSGDWFKMEGPQEIVVHLEAGEVRAEYFKIRVEDAGRHPFQVTAIGTEQSDAVRRFVEVRPDGRRRQVSWAGRIKGAVEHTVPIPANAVEGGSSIQVRVLPGLFSQVVDGMESMLRQPGGCFEQTSSTTYPNALVLQYLRETGTSSPLLESMALEYLNLGYQRLVSYEVPGGGFEWFGRPPGHRILTAYGLLEFSDMAKVMNIDPAILDRTRTWLLSQQESDGRFRAAAEGIHEGATNNFTDSDLRATAYIVYALLETGDRSSQTLSGLNWIRTNASTGSDAYTLGLVANALWLADPSDPVLAQVFERLDTMKVETGETAYWEATGASFTYSGGAGLTIETTAWVLQAYLRAGRMDVVDPGIEYLMANKGTWGAWGSTQGTILTIRLLLQRLKSSARGGAGSLRILHDGEEIGAFTVTEETSDLLRQLEVGSRVHSGDNGVRIEFEGDGNFMYQVVGTWYEPWEDAQGDELGMAIHYDRTEFRVGDVAQATAVVRNLGDVRRDMVMLDIGVPPGFQLQTADLTAWEADPALGVSRWERRGAQVTVYLYGLEPYKELQLPFRLQAKLAVQAQTPPSEAWLYYEPEIRTPARPITLTVR